MSVHNSTGASEQIEATPRVDSGTLLGEFEALRSGCGLFDLSSRARIALSGSDRVRWLNGMVTNNIRDLQVGHGVYAFLLNPQGHILGDLYAYNRGESLLVDTDHSQLQRILATFDHYIIMDDVEVANLSGEITGIGITGPTAGAILRASGFDVSDLQAPQFADLAWKNIGITVVRSHNQSVESYELWVAPANLDLLREALVRAGARPVGAAALELFRVACGIPRYGQDIRERDLPQETGQQRALHFSKGCYIGQEIVERIRSRGSVHRKFTGFAVQGPAPVAGAKLQADGRDVGEITSLASFPAKSGQAPSWRALGYVRREIAAGKTVTSGESQLIVTDLPFGDILVNR